MKNLFYKGYGIVAYISFVVSIAYLVGFLSNLVVPESIDSKPIDSSTVSTTINLLLITLFCLQHSIMARPWFKRILQKIAPEEMIRSTYVLASSATLLLLIWQWHPVPLVIWDIQSNFLRVALHALFWLGWVIALFSTFLISHGELFGLRKPAAPSPDNQKLTTRSLYRLVRHPILFGTVLSLWAAPTMTSGHLLLSSALTYYIVLAIPWEEAELVKRFGRKYRRYRDRTPAVMPLTKRYAWKSMTDRLLRRSWLDKD